MRVPKGFKSKCLEGHYLLPPCKEVGIVGQLNWSSAHARPNFFLSTFFREEEKEEGAAVGRQLAAWQV